MGKQDLLSVLDAGEHLEAILEASRVGKDRLRAGEAEASLSGKALALIFEKPSTRTRVSFEVGITQLGGAAIYLNPQELQLGRGETLEDTARVLSRYVDGIVYRARDHRHVVRLAEAASVPVINGLDDLEHPCQILADLFTIHEATGALAGRHLTYVGDGNNVCNSLLLGCALTGVHIAVATPKGYEPNADLYRQAQEIAQRTGSRVDLASDPQAAVKGADIVYTDVWVSMGMEAETNDRERVFQPYQVNEGLLEIAGPHAQVMHCLPAHRGHEITDGVLDGQRSLVWEQAENRLHVQKAILRWLLAGPD